MERTVTINNVLATEAQLRAALALFNKDNRTVNLRSKVRFTFKSKSTGETYTTMFAKIHGNDKAFWTLVLESWSRYESFSHIKLIDDFDSYDLPVTVINDTFNIEVLEIL